MSHTTDDRIRVLVDSIYEAAATGSSDAWAGINSELGKIMRSTANGLTIYSPDQDRYSAVTTNFPDGYLDEYAQHYHSVNPFAAIVGRLRPGNWFNREGVQSDSDFRKSAIYNDYFRKHDVFHMERHVFYRANGIVAGLSFARPDGHKNFTASDRRILTALQPHLERAFMLYMNMSDAVAQKTMIMAAFDCLPQGVVIAQRNLKVVFANKKAESLFRTGDGLSYGRDGKLRSTVGTDGRRLSAVVDRSLGRAGESSRLGSVMLVPRLSAPKPLRLLIAPFTCESSVEMAGPELVIMFISDHEETSKGLTDQLRTIYGLTAAEARVACMIAKGMSVDEICSALHVSANTARTHLKQVFAKTDTHRQNELSFLLNQIPSIFPDN